MGRYASLLFLVFIVAIFGVYCSLFLVSFLLFLLLLLILDLFFCSWWFLSCSFSILVFGSDFGFGSRDWDFLLWVFFMSLVLVNNSCCRPHARALHFSHACDHTLDLHFFSVNNTSNHLFVSLLLHPQHIYNGAHRLRCRLTGYGKQMSCWHLRLLGGQVSWLSCFLFSCTLIKLKLIHLLALLPRRAAYTTSHIACHMTGYEIITCRW